jgi:hypothetical protein
MWYTLAQTGIGDPPTLPAVDFPIDTVSVATEIAAGGGLIFILVITTAIGFVLAWRLFQRIRRGVGG